MNSENTPVRAARGRTMSTSLKERLKRCGRYHVNSPATTPHQQREILASPGLVKSDTLSSSDYCPQGSTASKKLTRNNSIKRKVDFCDDSVICGSSETDNRMPVKKKVAECQPELHGYDVTNSLLSSRNLEISLHVNSDSQHNGCDLARNGNVTASTSHSTPIVHTTKTTLRSANTCDSKDTKLKTTCCGAEGDMLLKQTKDKFYDPPLVSSSSCVLNNAGEVSPEETHCDPEDLATLNSQVYKLDCELKERTELHRKLKMVKMYRQKNDLTQLQKLIDRWRCVSQSALSDLLQLNPEPRPQMGDLISHLQIDPELVQFDKEEQDFC